VRRALLLVLLLAIVGCKVKYRGVIHPTQETDAWICEVLVDRAPNQNPISFTVTCTAKTGEVNADHLQARLFDGDHPTDQPTLAFDPITVRDGNQLERHGAFVPATRARPFVVHVTGMVHAAGKDTPLELTAPAP
jgi:hypothetical protein